MEGFDANQLDDVIHGRLRLGIMAYLASISPASFTDLAQKLETTNGNLSTHLRKLEEAGYIVQKKGYKGRRPHTAVEITNVGRDAWIDYLDTIKQLLE